MTNIPKTGDVYDNLMDGLGADTTLKGLAGNDTYTIDSYRDIVIEAAKAGDDDKVIFANGYDVGFTKAYTLAANIEELDVSNLQLSSAQIAAVSKTPYIINGNSLNNIIKTSINSADYIKIMAGAGDDTVIGADGNDNIDGGVGSDTLNGNGGADTLFGGADRVKDVLKGGSGDDTYVIRDLNDIIEDTADDKNTIKFDRSFTDKTLNLQTKYSDAGITTIDASLVGKSLTLTGNASVATTITGGSGSDVITGGSGNDSLSGGKGNDTLRGGAGVNVLDGGLGNDTYILDGSEISTNIVEATTGGTDTVKLVGNSNGAFAGNSNVLLGAFNNVENIDASAITSYTSNLNIIGNASNNKITAGAGNDTLDGGAGNNTLIGGAGDDTYILNSSKDRVTELADKKTKTGIIKYGNDTIVLSQNYNLGSSKSYTLIGNIENLNLKKLVLTDAQQAAFSGNTKLTINGNSLSNTIYASDDYGSSMKILAGAGDDNVIGGKGDDYIDGGAGNDTLFGGDGDNYLVGGSGNDTYEFDGTETGDTTIYDVSGIDTIKLLGDKDGSFQGDSSTFLTDFPKLENLDASAVTSSDLILNGNDLDNTITGGAGNDTIYGGKGKNTLYGGTGDDTYNVDGSEKSTSITDSSGNDTVALQADPSGSGKFAGGSAYSIAGFNGVEGLDASAITSLDATMTLTGNNLDNTITGGAGSSILDGGLGNDTYRISGTEKSTTIKDASGTADAIKLVANATEGFDGGDSFSLEKFATIENLDASDITTTDLTLTGNDSSNKIIGGAGDDTIYGGKNDDTLLGGTGNNVLDGGVGNDTYLIDGSEAGTSIVEDADVSIGGKDTIKLVADENGLFEGHTDLSIDDYTAVTNTVENLDASGVTSDLVLTGNDLGNTITGGSGNDYIDGGAGNDYIDGGATTGVTMLSSKSTYDSNGSLSVENYTYDAAGNKISSTVTGTDNAGTLQYEYENTYDADGKKTAYVYNSYTSGILTRLNSETYYPDGTKSTDNISQYYSSGVPASTSTTNTYDTDGNILKTEVTNCFADKSTSFHILTQYSNGHIVEEDFETYDSPGHLNITSVSTNTYAPDGNLLTHVLIQKDSGGNVKSTESFDSTLDSHGNPVTTTGHAWNNMGYDVSYTQAEYTHEYDENGNLSAVTSTKFDAMGQQVDYKEYKYTFDSDGNKLAETDSLFSQDGQTKQATNACTYDTKGNRLLVDNTQYSNGNKWSESISKYDPKGNLISQKTISYSQNSSNEDIFTYDAEGKKLTVETIQCEYSETSDSYIKTSDQIQTLDSKGNTFKVEYTSYYENGSIDSCDTYTQDADGNYLSDDYIEYDESGSLTTKGNIISKGVGTSTYYANGLLESSTYTGYSLQKGGQDAKMLLLASGGDENIQGGSFVIDSKEVKTFTYDSYGNVTKIVDNYFDGNNQPTGSDTFNYTNDYTSTYSSDNLFGGIGSNTLAGGIGNDIYQIDGTETATKITDKSGNDTLQLKDSNNDGKYSSVGGAAVDVASISLENYADVENIDGSAMKTTNLTLTGNKLDNVLTGGDGDDTLYGGDGNDTLDGGAGSNVLDGGKGNNTYLVDGTETLTTTIKDIYGVGTIKLVDTNGSFAGVDSFSLEDYADVENLDASNITTGMNLKGNSNISGNTLTGGTGDDTYHLDGTEVSTTIKDSKGNDTVKLDLLQDGTYGGNRTIDMSKFTGIENLDASAITDPSIGLTIKGNDLYNTITGGAGDDTISGGSGVNTLSGGKGNDTYVLVGDENETIINDSEGNNTLKLDVNKAFGSIYLNDTTHFGGIENVDASGNKNYINIYATIGADYNIKGGDANSDITTGDGNDTITGGAGNDNINAGEGKNIIHSGNGNNHLQAGLGSDTYYIDSSSTSISDAGGSNVNKAIITNNSIGSIDLSYSNVENLDASTLTSGLTVTDNTYGNGNNGYTDAATVSTGSGADVINYYSMDNLTINGNGGDDNISENSGSKVTLNGGAGNDTISLSSGGDGAGNINSINGGNGDDNITADSTTVNIDGGAGNDTISVYSSGGSINGGAGDDTYNMGDSASGSITDSAGIDTIVLTPDNDGLYRTPMYSIESTTGIDNLDASKITSEVLSNSGISGMALTGNELDNTITGSAGNDTIFGGAGNDKLVGGDGDDTYLVDSKTDTTTIVDASGNDTIKLVATEGVYTGNTTINMSDHSAIENFDASDITGNDFTITDSSSDNLIVGGAGNDSIISTSGNDSIAGGAGNDSILGGTGTDLIAGGTGDDILQGGTGSDTYMFNNGDAKDTIASGTKAEDTIYLNDSSGISKEDLLFYTDNSGNFYIDYTTGGAVGADVIKIEGYSTDTTVQLGDFSASLGSIFVTLAPAFKNLTDTSGLTKGSQSGITWFDSSGNNTYSIDGTEIKRIPEIEGGGNDTLKLVSKAGDGTFVGVNPSLYPTSSTIVIDNLSNAANTIENVDASAITTGLTITGNDLDNSITGGSGDDTLYGGNGNDQLYGGDGSDTYLINSPGNSSITDNGTGVNDSDTVKLVADSNGKFSGNDSYYLNLPQYYTGIENIDASAITHTDLTLYGDDWAANTLIGGAGNDTIRATSGSMTSLGGVGKDVMKGGAGDDTYLIDGTEASFSIQDTSGTKDTVQLTTYDYYSGGNKLYDLKDYSISLVDTGVENLNGSEISGTNLTLTGNDSDNVISTGHKNNNILDGGAGNDTYVLNGYELSTTITDASGTDTVKLAGTGIGGHGAYAGRNAAAVSMATNVGIENIDASTIEGTALTLTGNNSGNSITGGNGDDVIIGGKGNDTLTGGNGSNTYSFSSGDGKDLITAASSFDVINIVSSSSLTRADLLFYQDSAGNFFVDYTDGGVGSDVAEIAAGTYDNDTTIQVGPNTISIGSIIDKLGSSLVVDPAQITTGNKATQSTALTSDWSNMGGDNIYLINGSEIPLIKEKANGGNDTLQLVADSNGNFNGNNNITIDNFTTIPNMIENVDASAITNSSLTIHGNNLDNTLKGGAGSNYLYGGSGNDTYLIDGTEGYVQISENYGDGIDTIGGGNDTIKFVNDSTGKFNDNEDYQVNLGSYNYYSIENIDGSGVKANLTLYGSDATNTLIGGAGNDTICGSAGGNTNYGGAGKDVLKGGAGDDTYLIDGTEASFSIQDDSGNDTLKLVASWNGYYTYNNNVNVSMAGNQVETLDASAVLNTNLNLIGNDMDNTIIGGSAGDVITGGKGNDTLTGGDGANIYSFSSGDGKDLITAASSSDVINIVSSSSLTKADLLFYKDSAGNFFVDYTDNGVGSDVVKISAGNYDKDTTIQFGSTYITIGSIGAAVLDPTKIKIANKTMQSAALNSKWTDVGGDNTYLINGTESVKIKEMANCGNDTLKAVADTNGAFVVTGSVYSGSNHIGIDDLTSTANTIENVDASAIKTTDLNISGNDLNNSLVGGAGNDSMYGGYGDDTLQGGAGSNYLYGEYGNDTYIIDGTESATNISEYYGDGSYPNDGGNDTVKLVNDSTGKFKDNTDYKVDLGNYYNVENIDGSGVNANLVLYGNDSNNTITGGTGNDTICGSTETNTNYGGAGNDVLKGGAGDDVYIIDDADASFRIQDDSGNDTIKLKQIWGGYYRGNSDDAASLASFGDVENLDASGITRTNLTLTGNDLDNKITGGAGNDTIDGGKGNNILIGGAGNDTYLVDGSGVNTITDSAGTNDTVKLVANASGAYAGGSSVSMAAFSGIESLDGSNIKTDLTLTGNAENNTIRGGSGNNILAGGDGNDTYQISGTEKSTTINDSAGSNTIQFMADSNGKFNNNTSYSASVTNYAGIENLDGSAILATNLSLTGDGLSNTLQGGYGNNVLDGGAGDDTYVLMGDGATTTITDADGNDTIKLATGSSGSYSGNGSVSLDSFSTVADTLENLDASAITASALALTGNNSANTIIGGGGDDNIVGGKGDDTLTGGAGANTYSFAEGDGKDLITSSNAADTIAIDSASGLTKNDVLFYRDKTGNLFVDYTKGEPGSDIVEIAAGNYNNGTIIQVGINTITVGEVIASLGSTELTSGEISALTSVDKSTQSGTLDLTWFDPSHDNTYSVSGNLQKTITEINASIDTVKLVDDGSGYFNATGPLFPGGANVSLDTISTNANTLENLDATAITKNNLTLQGNNLANSITGGGGSDTIYGGEGNDTLAGGVGDIAPVNGQYSYTYKDYNGQYYTSSYSDPRLGYGCQDVLIGGAGDDTYLFDGDENYSIYGRDLVKTRVTETSDGGNDTIKLVSTAGDGSYGKSNTADDIEQLTLDTVSTNAGTIENIDASDIYTNKGYTLGLYGTAFDNKIVGSQTIDDIDGYAGNDTITGGKGNDTLRGGQGADTFIFNEGDGQDIINDWNMDSSDIIKIDNADLTKGDLLFYTDASKHLFIDYTKAGGGTDVIKGQFDITSAGISAMTVKIGNDTIHVNQILASLVAGTTGGLETDGITALTADAETAKLAQASILTTVWNT